MLVPLGLEILHHGLEIPNDRLIQRIVGILEVAVEGGAA